MKTDVEDWQLWDRTLYWHPFSQMAEYDGLIVETAQGCWLTTTDGRRILDGTSSLWCNIHGHRHPVIDQAIIAQLQKVAHVTGLGMSHPETIRLAKRLVDLSPDGLNHVFFSSDGASAVEVAMKMAFQYWRQIENPQLTRNLFVAVGNAYHGDTIGTTSVGGVSRFRDLFAPLLFPVLRGPTPSIDPHNQSLDTNGDALNELLIAYERLLEKNQGSVAAVIVEPLVQAAAGVVIQPKGFLRGLAELCRRFDTLLIADEVAVAFGRTGSMFACEQEAVCPDLMCLGKGLTGGYLPMSATLCSSRIWEAFLGTGESGRTFYYGHTYAGNALAAAAANATLDLFEKEEVLDRLIDKSKLLGELLSELPKRHPYLRVRQCGFIAAVESMAGDVKSSQSFNDIRQWSRRVCERTLAGGVWLRPLGNVIPIVPPLAISNEDLHLLIATLSDSIAG